MVVCVCVFVCRGVGDLGGLSPLGSLRRLEPVLSVKGRSSLGPFVSDEGCCLCPCLLTSPLPTQASDGVVGKGLGSLLLLLTFPEGKLAS